MRAVILVLLVASVAVESLAATPTDWQGVDVGANTATGSLASTSVSLATDLAVVRPSLGDSGVVGGILDGSYAGFADGAVFTPSVLLSDAIVLGATSWFTVTFSPPVKDPVFHIHQLADNQLAFSAPFVVLSKTADLTAATPALSGVSDADDASGSIRFDGIHAAISWTSSPAGSSAARENDGIWVQISQPAPVPVPLVDHRGTALLATLLLLVGAAVAARRQRGWGVR